MNSGRTFKAGNGVATTTGTRAANSFHATTRRSKNAASAATTGSKNRRAKHMNPLYRYNGYTDERERVDYMRNAQHSKTTNRWIMPKFNRRGKIIK